LGISSALKMMDSSICSINEDAADEEEHIRIFWQRLYSNNIVSLKCNVKLVPC
jgi:hypothetical protein